MTHTAELLPCPFCGGEACYASTRFGYPASHWAKCGNCGSCTTEYSNREAAARAWNTRTDAQLRADRDSLLEALRMTLRFIENTEGELGITLDSGEHARALISRIRGEVE